MKLSFKLKFTKLVIKLLMSIQSILHNLSAVNTPAMSFSITGGSPAAGSVVGTNCATDWITIPCATNSMDPTAQTGTPSTCVDRICGMVFNSVTAASTTSPTSVYSKSSLFLAFSIGVKGMRSFFRKSFFRMFLQNSLMNVLLQFLTFLLLS